MQPLPKIKPTYSDEELAEMNPTKGLAALFGCPRHDIWLVDDRAYTPEFDSVSFKHDHRVVDITAEEQHEYAQQLLHGPLFSDPPSLIVINANLLLPAKRFLHFLICEIAKQRIKAKNQKLDFAYFGTAELRPALGYVTKPRHVLAWGPISDKATGYSRQQAIDFLAGFDHHTRILLVAADDIGEMLADLLLSPGDTPYIFNFGKSKPKKAKKR